GPGCAGDLAGVTVSIPRFRETVTGADGRFQFSDLTYGNYYLQFAPNCPLIPCYPDRIVFIDASGDVDIDVCRDDCPATALLSLRSGAPGSLLDVSGRCDAARGESLAIWFDDRQISTLTADADGVYHGTVTVPPDVAPDAEHLVRAELGEHEIASGDFMTVYGAAPCVGDCNRDGTVTIDELLRGIRIALGLDTTAACYSMDASSNGVVSIEELITGVQRALSGCQRADLVPLDARYSRCVDYACYAAEQIPAFMNVCVANQGDADSGGFLIYESTTGFSVFAPPLLAGAQECVEMRLVEDPEIEVDASQLIPEHDETNNFLVTSIPVRTACDVVPPPCTPTPPPTVTQTPTPT
ncbi:MAG TPA: hypothetical protein VL049_22950, partial [Candidatus Dormibacteraeota bacterium]|nr:hypothetical protein [Candidatus Dormibacteraeota bacterium]